MAQGRGRTPMILLLVTLCLQTFTGQCQGQPSDLRIVLVGKTGVGKSATGNTILGTEVFKVEAKAESVTAKCKKGSGEVHGRKIDVIDTPGLFDTTMSVEQMKSELERCIYMSVPGPHVFLLVIRLGRFTEEERNAVKWIQENFGEDASMYTMVLFTGEDQIGNKSVSEFLKESKELQKLVTSCGNRYHSIINVKRENRTQVRELLRKIEQVVEDNGGLYYTNQDYKKAQEKIKEEMWKYCKYAALGGAAVTLAGAFFSSPTLVTAGLVGGLSQGYECTKEMFGLPQMNFAELLTQNFFGLEGLAHARLALARGTTGVFYYPGPGDTKGCTFSP
ncbi:GTPase IMAP family member 7 isoform X2 [Coregonus clupeaformis]|uniref:GTPase IMAP family member 7 isoform X2 n=1 Tax=Coregonus clupeaformis TaxID=59861 RepID=UPI001BDF7611|nr:GTPase IMAP family member 7 isoform X2 [Coregonus clupeaformis]